MDVPAFPKQKDPGFGMDVSSSRHVKTTSLMALKLTTDWWPSLEVVGHTSHSKHYEKRDQIPYPDICGKHVTNRRILECFLATIQQLTSARFPVAF